MAYSPIFHVWGQVVHFIFSLSPVLQVHIQRVFVGWLYVISWGLYYVIRVQIVLHAHNESVETEQNEHCGEQWGRTVLRAAICVHSVFGSNDDSLLSSKRSPVFCATYGMWALFSFLWCAFFVIPCGDIGSPKRGIIPFRLEDWCLDCCEINSTPVMGNWGKVWCCCSKRTPPIVHVFISQRGGPHSERSTGVFDTWCENEQLHCFCYPNWSCASLNWIFDAGITDRSTKRRVHRTCSACPSTRWQWTIYTI